MNKNDKFIFKCEHDKEHPYTRISNTVHFSDLSFEAHSLLCRVLAYPEYYKFHPTVWYKKFPRRYVDSAIRELIKKGFCKKVKISRREVDFYFYETPIKVGEDVRSVHQNSEKVDVQNEHLRCTEHTPQMYGAYTSDVRSVHLLSNKENNNINIINTNVSTNIEYSKINDKISLQNNQMTDLEKKRIDVQNDQHLRMMYGKFNDHYLLHPRFKLNDFLQNIQMMEYEGYTFQAISERLDSILTEQRKLNNIDKVQIEDKQEFLSLMKSGCLMNDQDKGEEILCKEEKDGLNSPNEEIDDYDIIDFDSIDNYEYKGKY